MKKLSGTHLWSAPCPTLHCPKASHFSQGTEQSKVMVTESIDSSQNSEVINQVQDPSRGFSHEHKEIGLEAGLKKSYGACPQGPSRRQATFNIYPRPIHVTGPYRAGAKATYNGHSMFIQETGLQTGTATEWLCGLRTVTSDVSVTGCPAEG